MRSHQTRQEAIDVEALRGYGEALKLQDREVSAPQLATP
jgi:hypothetical protein